MGKKIDVSEKVYDMLIKIKRRDGHKSIDSVIRYLLMKSGEVI